MKYFRGKHRESLGRGDAQVVSVFAFYSYYPGSNLAEACSFSVKFVF